MADSPFDPRPLRQARALLAEPAPAQAGLGAVMGAAVLFAASALVLMFVVISLPSPWPT